MLDEWVTGLADGYHPAYHGRRLRRHAGRGQHPAFLTGRQSLQGAKHLLDRSLAAAGGGSPGYTWTTDTLCTLEAVRRDSAAQLPTGRGFRTNANATVTYTRPDGTQLLLIATQHN